jgi:hypothetical protein
MNIIIIIFKPTKLVRLRAESLQQEEMLRHHTPSAAFKQPRTIKSFVNLPCACCIYSQACCCKWSCLTVPSTALCDQMTAPNAADKSSKSSHACSSSTQGMRKSQCVKEGLVAIPTQAESPWAL